MSKKSKRSMTSMLITILVLLLAITGITALAANGFSEDWRQASTAGNLDQPTNLIDDDDQQQKSELSHEISSQTLIDATSSATQVPKGQKSNIVAPDVTASATVRLDDDDNDSEDCDEDEGEDHDEDEDGYKDDDRSDGTAAGQLISLNQAKAIALAQIGNDAQILSIELEADDYPPVYEIELKAGDQTIELTIHAITGAVLEQDRESNGAPDDDNDDEDDNEDDNEDDTDDDTDDDDDDDVTE